MSKKNNAFKIGDIVTCIGSDRLHMVIATTTSPHPCNWGLEKEVADNLNFPAERQVLPGCDLTVVKLSSGFSPYLDVRFSDLTNPPNKWLETWKSPSVDGLFLFVLANRYNCEKFQGLNIASTFFAASRKLSPVTLVPKNNSSSLLI